jgi:hypothetical protein
VLVVGNWYNDASHGEVFDPVANTWTDTGPLNTPGWAGAEVLPTNDGGAVVFGGVINNGWTLCLQVEYYNPVSNSFSNLTPNPFVNGLRPNFDWGAKPVSRPLPDGRYLLFDQSRLVMYTFDPATKQFAVFTPAVPLTGLIHSMLVDAARARVYLLN